MPSFDETSRKILNPSFGFVGGERRPQMLVVFLGPPGVGKGTQARRLVAELGIPHISTGDMLRDEIERESSLGKKAADCINDGQLLPDDLIIEMVCQRIREPDCSKGCLLDGFPRTVGQAQALDEFLAKNDRRLSVVLRLIVAEEELRRRLGERAKCEGRADDVPDTVTERFRVYEKSTAPVVGYYRERRLLRDINGEQTPDEVYKTIFGIIRSVA